MLEFASQGRRSIEKAKRYRERAQDDTLDEIDRARLLAAARAVELDARDWLVVARELAQ